VIEDRLKEKENKERKQNLIEKKNKVKEGKQINKHIKNGG
jgi:hypothetical protein